MKTREDRLALARRIMELVSAEFGFSCGELVGPDRPAPLAWARQVGMAVTYDLSRLTQKKIADVWGRDRRTVSFALQAVKNRIDTDHYSAKRVVAIRRKAQAFVENH